MGHSRIPSTAMTSAIQKTFYATVSDYRNVRRVEPIQASHLEAAWDAARAKFKGTTDFLVGVRSNNEVFNLET
jgi:hypothetical protein